MARITTLLKTCEYCENQFETLDARKRFCNRSCSASLSNRRYPKRVAALKVPKKLLIDKWLDGEWDGTIKSGLSTTVRNFLLKEAGYKCQDGRSGCNEWSGINPKTGKTCLTVDHTDGDCTNNTRENLVVMCPNCHSMTPTYGALNKGNSRRTHRYVAITQLVE